MELLILSKIILTMQEASILGFIKTLIYIIAIYYIIKFLAKLFLPMLVKKVVQKAGENFEKQQQEPQGYSWQKTANSDKIIIDATNAKKSRETKKVGEYVNYEEID
jgi:DNA integrity scanning protein DisA with diadenylate cyclase activity